jgi:excisionase family DNA binding protein
LFPYFIADFLVLLELEKNSHTASGTSDDRSQTVKEIAECLHVKPQTVRLWICQRKSPFYHIDRSVRFRPSQIERPLAANHVDVATW